MVTLSKDAERDLELTLDFGASRGGAVETETLHAPALDAREAHITPRDEAAVLKQGRS